MNWLCPSPEEQEAIDRIKLVMKLRGDDSSWEVVYKPLRTPKSRWDGMYNRPVNDHIDYWRSARPWHLRRFNRVKTFIRIENLEEYINTQT